MSSDHIEDIKHDLKDNGWFFGKSLYTLEGFEALGQRLGEIIARTDISIDETRSVYQVRTAGGLTLHMDDPPARYIAWLGMVTPEQEEPTKFLDTRPILEMLSPEELTRIKSIQVKDDNGLIHPMLADDGVFHYVPWMIQMQTVTDNDTFEALAHLQSLIRKATRTCHTINIQKGEILIVDNTRVIHGRDRIAADSQRHLKRLWIK
ncbi:MAG: hypothetical protein CMH56_08710 [Myxococcales bacterium]|nr:hypothetical protein [Myxococcales bacterium]